MERAVENDLEQASVYLIGDIQGLNRLDAHILGRKQWQEANGITYDPNLDAFFRMRRSLLQKIYRNLLLLDIDSPLFQAVLADMVPVEEHIGFRQQLVDFREKVEMLLAG